MRGTRIASECEIDVVRIIPADAGNTLSVSRYVFRQGDHPRGCGEHNASCTTRSQSGGSSPRMRGTHLENSYDMDTLGIIPADAGNTTIHPSANPYTRDHPRGCGEHPCMEPTETPWAGSSPRMRGTHHGVQLFGDRAGIIPADAGNTVPPAIWPYHPQDHPRGCGEHRRSSLGSSIQVGSSPRMRGTLR